MQNGDPHAVVEGLENGRTYEFSVKAFAGDRTVLAKSKPVRVTPRDRGRCAWIRYSPWDRQMSVFCTQAALNRYLRDHAITPLSLKCRGQRITQWGIPSPDCLYLAPDGQQLLLLRSADSTFVPRPSYPSANQVRDVARALIWPGGHPFSQARPPQLVAEIPVQVGSVKHHRSATSYAIAVSTDLTSRVTWFTPERSVSEQYAIYHEGHGGASVVIGASTIDWLLTRGWQVIAVDMPLHGLNEVDAGNGFTFHGDLAPRESGGLSLTSKFLEPLKAIVDLIVKQNGGRDPAILLIGRSGGGWTTYTYAAVDPRIDAAVSVAGGRPISERLDVGWWIPAGLEALELGDYEQFDPSIFSVVRHEDLMIAAGARGSLHMFSTGDPCCFRVRPNDAFAAYLERASGPMGKPVRVFIDPTHREHSIGDAGYRVLDTFLTDMFQGSR